MSDPSAPLGTVVLTQGPVYFVELTPGQPPLQCSLTGRRLPGGKPVVGDRVQLRLTEPERGVITATEPRRTVLQRAGFRGRNDRVLVANIDQLVIVASAHQPPLRPGLVDRYIVAAEKQAMAPVLCFNKWELASDDERAVAAVYDELGYPCLRASAATGQGIEALAAQLQGRRSAFVGHSGVGKTSLMRHLFPNVDLTIGDLSARTGRGRHTTTHARLLPIAGGGHVVDTPGVREFGLVAIDSAELASLYVDFSPHADACRFSPCSHTHEPGCAVKEAIASGALHPLRYEGYARLYEELRQEERSRRY